MDNNESKPKTMDTAMNFMEYLYIRWQDEKEYEDFKEYEGGMIKNLPDGATMESMTKRPFRCIFRLADGTRKWIKVTSTAITCGGFVKRV